MPAKRFFASMSRKTAGEAHKYFICPSVVLSTGGLFYFKEEYSEKVFNGFGCDV